MNKRILVVDDEKNIRLVLEQMLELKGYKVELAADGRQCLEKTEGFRPHIILLDQKMPTMDGLQTIDALSNRGFEGKVIMMTAFGSIPNAVEAMQKGAFDYLAKPYDNEELLIIIERAFTQIRLESELTAAKSRLEDKFSVSGIITKNSEMKRIIEVIKQIAPTDAPVLVTGESGTGKELFANAVHQHSHRKSGPFIALNCGALPENLVESELFGYKPGAFTGAGRAKRGLVEQADGGTLFLDEIAEAGTAIQVKLLRFLQDGEFMPLGDTGTRKVDVRIIAATNKDLARAIEGGSFREDLYYRLNVVPLAIPPLRERTEDIVPLVNHFISKYGAKIGKADVVFSPEIIDSLMLHDWPGNIRELENVVHNALLMAQKKTIMMEDIHLGLRAGVHHSSGAKKPESLPEIVETYVERIEKKEISSALIACENNQSEAARRLGIDRRTLIRKINRYNITINR